MKIFANSFLCAACLTAILFIFNSCNGVRDLQTKTYSFEDSTAYAHFKAQAELPAGTDKVSAAVRGELQKLVDARLAGITSYENERYFDAYAGDAADVDAYMKYYYDNALATIGKLSDDDVAERSAYLEEDEDLTDERKAEILAEMPGWEYEFGLEKIEETDSYAVFQSMDYIYMGGAHGGMLGEGCITFSKKDGHRVAEILDPSCTADIQPLLRDGLAKYFSSEGEQVGADNLRDFLMIEDDMIPLPAWQPYPTKDGLAFTYQQYEIAAYAAGMPSFTLPFDDVAPYLSEDAKALLNL